MILFPMKIQKAPSTSLLVDIAICVVFPLLALTLAAFSARWLDPETVISPRIIAAAYPEAIQGLRYNASGWTMLLANGRTAVFSDGRDLPFEERLDHMDVASVLLQRYPFGNIPVPVQEYRDPGRLRYYPLLESAYGATRQEVEQNLETVAFLGMKLPFNRRNGAAEALRQTVKEIQATPELLAFLQPIADTRIDGVPLIGTYYWRLTEGTERLSAHSFGIAVDIQVPEATKPMYWRWIKGATPEHFDNAPEIETMPSRLVQVFEKHGFIWGGKWHHFDTMHFEYRPEFLAQERFLNMTWKGWQRPARAAVDDHDATAKTVSSGKRQQPI